MTNTKIREKARQDLGGNIFGTNWMIGLVISLIQSILLSGCSSVVPIIGSLLIAGPLAVGVYGAFLSNARRGEPLKLEDMFGGFNNFGDNFLIGLMISIFTFLWSLLFIIPGIVKSYAYSMAYYIKNDHPEYSWRECLDESQRIMSGNKGKLFLLDLSFIGWILLGMLCCFIGVLWVAPYMEAARANFYEIIKHEIERE